MDTVLMFQPAACGVRTPFREVVFQGRPTAVALTICGGELLLTQPEKVERDGNKRTWGPPQGGVNFARDSCFRDTLIRELREELAFEEKYLRADPVLLGQCLNPIPRERNEAFEFKHLFFFALPVWKKSWVRPGPEVRRVEWVHSWFHLEALIGAMLEVRPVKYQATREAVGRARTEGFLHWNGEPCMA